MKLHGPYSTDIYGAKIYQEGRYYVTRDKRPVPPVEAYEEQLA